MKKKQPSEFDILQLFAEEMDRTGHNRKLVHLSITEEMVEKINQKNKTQVNIDVLQRLADKCLANEWLEHTVMGCGQYGELSLTTTGFGVIRSRQRKEEVLSQRSIFKKASDFIEDHKGLFIFFGSAIALAGLLVKIFSGGK
jgi:hypothetical protein